MTCVMELFELIRVIPVLAICAWVIELILSYEPNSGLQSLPPNSLSRDRKCQEPDGSSEGLLLDDYTIGHADTSGHSMTTDQDMTLGHGMNSMTSQHGLTSCHEGTSQTECSSKEEGGGTQDKVTESQLCSAHQHDFHHPPASETDVNVASDLQFNLTNSLCASDLQSSQTNLHDVFDLSTKTPTLRDATIGCDSLPDISDIPSLQPTPLCTSEPPLYPPNDHDDYNCDAEFRRHNFINDTRETQTFHDVHPSSHHYLQINTTQAYDPGSLQPPISPTDNHGILDHSSERNVSLDNSVTNTREIIDGRWNGVLSHDQYNCDVRRDGRRSGLAFPADASEEDIFQHEEHFLDLFGYSDNDQPTTDQSMSFKNKRFAVALPDDFCLPDQHDEMLLPAGSSQTRVKKWQPVSKGRCGDYRDRSVGRAGSEPSDQSADDFNIHTNPPSRTRFWSEGQSHVCPEEFDPQLLYGPVVHETENPPRSFSPYATLTSTQHHAIYKKKPLYKSASRSCENIDILVEETSELDAHENSQEITQLSKPKSNVAQTMHRRMRSDPTECKSRLLQEGSPSNLLFRERVVPNMLGGSTTHITVQCENYYHLESSSGVQIGAGNTMNQGSVDADLEMDADFSPAYDDVFFQVHERPEITVTDGVAAEEQSEREVGRLGRVTPATPTSEMECVQKHMYDELSKYRESKLAGTPKRKTNPLKRMWRGLTEGTVK